MNEAKAFRIEIETLLDKRNYQLALKKLDEKNIEEIKENLYMLYELASSYIDLGTESSNISAVNKGILIFQNNSETLKKVISEQNINYCLGNGFSAIHKIGDKNGDGEFPTPSKAKGSLFKAKKAYLKAFKELEPGNVDELSIKVFTNLGNNLKFSGRIVEALQLFDTALKYDNDLAEAVVSKAQTLDYMLRSTDCEQNISLFLEIYILFEKASKVRFPIKGFNEMIELKREKITEVLRFHNYDLGELDNELYLNGQEYLKHPVNVKFYLDNFLSLSEHGLYCKCNRAKQDDLTIGFPGLSTGDSKLVKLELLNNRLKSEFSFARKLYFDFSTKELVDSMHYQEFLEDEINGINQEQLRASFRMCFGILDKIAGGICDLFDLEVKINELIYFESFWNNPKVPSRWNEINSFSNIHLTALYSIACDLNKSDGEFGFYKKWRNKLEHGMFTIFKDNLGNEAWEIEEFSDRTSEVNFESKTKHLLQLTRAAIFSYVFCVRQEMIIKKGKPS